MRARCQEQKHKAILSSPITTKQDHHRNSTPCFSDAHPGPSFECQFLRLDSALLLESSPRLVSRYLQYLSTVPSGSSSDTRSFSLYQRDNSILPRHLADIEEVCTCLPSVDAIAEHWVRFLRRRFPGPTCTTSTIEFMSWRFP